MEQVPQNIANFFSRIGAFIYQNVLLYIPPGTGAVLIVAAVIGIIVGIYYWTTQRKSDKQLKSDTNVDFKPVIDAITLTRKGVNDYLDLAGVQSSKNNWVLLNFAALTVAHAGYKGPEMDGIFDTEAIRNSLDMGFRCFVFDIDMYEGKNKDPASFPPAGEPCLLYRDNQGVIRSRNAGKIDEMMTALVEQAFSPSMPTGNDPLIVILNFKNTPDPVKNQAEYMTFLKKVSEKIQPLARRYLDRLGETSFAAMANQDVLFTQSFQALRGKVIIFTNVNTDLFINPKETIPREKNLRSWINAQIYSLSSDLIPKDTVTEVQPKGKPMSVGIQNGDYFLNTPPGKVKDAQLKTNNVYALLNPPEAYKNYSAETFKTLTATYGVQMTMFNPFVTPQETDEFFKRWGEHSWKLKPKELQYIVNRVPPPKPVSVRADANGGNINPPGLNL